MRTRMCQLLLVSGCFFIALMATSCSKSEETEATASNENLSITELAARSMSGQTMEDEAAAVATVVEAAGFKKRSYTEFPSQEVDRKGRVLVYADKSGKSGGVIYFKKGPAEIRQTWHWYFPNVVPDSVTHEEINDDGLWDLVVHAPGGRAIEFIQDETFTLMARERHDWLALNGEASPPAGEKGEVWRCLDGDPATAWTSALESGEVFIEFPAPFGVNESILKLRTLDENQPQHCALFADGRKVQDFDLKAEAAEQMIQLDGAVKGAKKIRLVIESSYGGGMVSISELALQ